jgi:hypothetical protein
MRTPAFLLGVLTCIVAAPAAAQVLQRDFDGARNGPWSVTRLAVGDASCDPRSVVLHDGAPHLACKVPLDGPPAGGAVLRVEGGRATVVGGVLDDDPAMLTVVDGALLVATKGSAGRAVPRVLRLDGGAWRQVHDQPLGAEVRAVAAHDGGLAIATKSDGVYRLDGGALHRVGARTRIVPDGYVWSSLGDWTPDVHDATIDGATVVATGKDLRVRRWDGVAWSDLGNLAEAVYDGGAVPTSFLREPKSVAIGPDGVLYAGTKGMAGSPEGKDVGAVWRWDGTTWTRLGSAVLRKEVKRIVALGGALWVGTNESGVWRWDGAEWVAASDGLPADDDGKIKGERLALGIDGALYAGVGNAVLRRAPGDAAWTEVGFFPNGEEVTSVLVDGGGTMWVGAKVGTGSGAVYQRVGDGWRQLGGDLAREVKHLVRTGADEVYAVMGGGAGAARWDGAAWVSVLGNLTGDASDFKALLMITDVDMVAVTKVGLQRGAFQRQPLEIVESPLRNLDIGGMVAIGADLFVATKQDGVLRLAADPQGDDGRWWLPGSAGLPDVELTGIVALGARIVVIGKRLLYDAAVGADHQLQATALGANTGKAALDGNGSLVFVGETEFTAVASHGDRLFAGTKDGLFASSNGGNTWELFNGPAEVKSLTIVGDQLHALVVSRVVPDPVGAPTVEVQASALWTRDLAVESSPEPPADDGGCATSSGAGVGVILLVGLALFPVWMRRSGKGGKPRSWLSWSRTMHTWAGIGLGLVILVEGCTGLFLLHEDDVPGLAKAPLPFTGDPGRPATLERVALDPGDPAHLVAASQDRVVHSRDGGATWSVVSPTSGFDGVDALTVAAGALWVGDEQRLARCTLDGAACAAVDLGVDGRAEVRAVTAVGDRLIVALHRHGVRVSDDGGSTWSDASADLWRDPRALDDKGEHHVHGVARSGATLWVATSAGLFRSDGDGWAVAGLAGRDLDGVVVTGDGALWVTARKPAPGLLVSRDGGVAWRAIALDGEPREGGLVAAPGTSDRVLVATKDAVYAAGPDGAVPVVLPLPARGVTALATAGDRAVAARGDRVALLGASGWQRAAAPVVIAGGQKPMTVGKFLDELHTGALFGHALWVVYDLGALAMILFVFTGVHLWITPLLVKRRKRAKQAAKAAPADRAGPA